MSFSYKGLSFSEASGPFVRHMASLNDHRETLKALQSSWDTLALLGHLSSMKADMGETRAAFDGLTQELMATLADETLARAISGLGYTAQVAIDILTRNLFERTADIGFLATDDAVVAVAASEDEAALAALRERFRTYARRYTVYRDIVLADPQGRVRVRMADAPAGVHVGVGARSQAALIAQAVQARGAYVEHYGDTDFCGGIALTYTSAVGAQRCTGVLSLVFDLDDEAQRMFARLAGEDELIAYVDAQGRVVASNDALRLPRGAKAPAVDRHHRVRLGGQTYVAVRRDPQPYQGYAGPGWSALALMPAELAFEHVGGGTDDEAAARFSGEGFFSERLLAVPRQAAAIQGNLDRVVWNGHLQPGNARGNDGFSRALLQEIAATGRRTKSVFEAATGELLNTVTATVLDEARFLSGLAVEILDRNLYERACDCRWWAENATLASMDPADAAKVLAHINALYTVYTDILLFDDAGRVIASSASASATGQTLNAPWVAACLGLREPMGYAVSPFQATPLYGGRSTYVYAAPLREAGRVVGGVGLVFDATPQFEAMLAAALPAREGSVGAFVRPDGTLVGATRALPFALHSDVLGLAPGAAWNGIVTHEGRCYAVGATAGSGYREFKTDDGYAETVIAVVIVPCGIAASASGPVHAPLQAVAAGGVEVATFRIGEQLAGLPAAEVVACIDVRQAVSLPAAQGSTLAGYTTWQGAALPLVDLGAAFAQRGAPHRHAIVLAHRGLRFGLLVSDLGAIVELQVVAAPTAPVRHAGVELVTQIARSGPALLPMLSSARVAAVSVASGLPLEAAEVVQAPLGLREAVRA